MGMGPNFGTWKHKKKSMKLMFDFMPMVSKSWREQFLVYMFVCNKI